MMATVFTNRPSRRCSQTRPSGISYGSLVPKVIVFSTLQDCPPDLDFVVPLGDVAG